MESAPPPPRRPLTLGALAGAGLAGLLVTISAASLAAVFGVSVSNALCPLVAVAGFFIAQIVIAKLFRMPMKGPEEAMGTLEDEPADGEK